MADRLRLARDNERALLMADEELLQSQVEQLQQSQKAEAAEMASRAKSTFLSNMSHEIRTPMNAILSYAQLMQHDPELTPPLKRNLDIINRSGEHLLALINDVLEVSKIEAGRVQLNPSHVDLQALLKDIQAMFQVHCDSKGLQLLIEFELAAWRFVYVDAQKLNQILINLLGNVLKFTDEGGICLRVRLLPDTINEGLLLAVEIEDSGQGIAELDYDKVFGSFEQTASGLNTGQGSGLGLVISREYARLMGGDVTFLSQLGQGSLFRLQLHCGIGDGSAVAPVVDVDRVIGLTAGTTAPKVLLVDDHMANRDLLRQLLQPLGFELMEAANGAEAFEICNAWRPDMVLMDQRMPVMTGAQAMARIKATPWGRQTPVVAISASAFDEDRLNILQQGADDFIRKPFKNSEVLEAIGRFLKLSYVYQDGDGAATNKAEENEVSPLPVSEAVLRQQLQTLSTTLRLSLRERVLVGDIAGMKRLLEAMGEEQSDLMLVISKALAAFDYDAILVLLERAD